MKNEIDLKKIIWKDLTKLSPKQVFIENTITLPWLAASWAFAYYHFYFLAAPCSVMFFLTALRQSHNGYHRSLGTSKKMTGLVLYVNSILMLVSSHAVKFNHLRHHKYYPGEEDHEGKCAGMRWWAAILHGPRHIYDIHHITRKYGNKIYRKELFTELFSILLFMAIVFICRIDFLVYHIIAMLISEFFSAFFAVWTVHHDLEEGMIARTQRKKWKNKITYNMFYHLEHHLFPAVPAIRLHELAERIDEAFPDMVKKETF